MALTTPRSTGQCEGQICRLKLIKRLGYGGLSRTCCVSGCSTGGQANRTHSTFVDLAHVDIGFTKLADEPNLPPPLI